MPSRALVVDANILVRAVLGKRVREVIEAYAEDVSFFVPEVAFAEAEEHLPALVNKHGGDAGKALAFLHTLGRVGHQNAVCEKNQAIAHGIVLALTDSVQLRSD